MKDEDLVVKLIIQPAQEFSKLQIFHGEQLIVVILDLNREQTRRINSLIELKSFKNIVWQVTEYNYSLISFGHIDVNHYTIDFINMPLSINPISNNCNNQPIICAFQ